MNIFIRFIYLQFIYLIFSRIFNYMFENCNSLSYYYIQRYLACLRYKLSPIKWFVMSSRIVINQSFPESHSLTNQETAIVLSPHALSRARGCSVTRRVTHHSLLSVNRPLISSRLTYVHVGVLSFHENAPLSPRSMTMRGLDRG